MDIDEIVARKNELVDLLNEAEENEAHEKDEQSYSEVAEMQAELDEIEELESELACTVESAARNGVYFIHENDFEDHARELAYSIGAIDNEHEWPVCHIDWESAAESLKMDYSEVDWQGDTYFFRD